MCGLVGLWDRGALHRGGELNALVTAMADTLAHRGPDDCGTWSDASSGIALGHRRLSIIDLSPAGHQPMLSHSGRFVIVYNGEIYNYRDLAAELACEMGFLRLRGHSDTEVLLHGFEHWGVRKTLERCNGMFAFALWDSIEQVLWLGRDPLGKKPLYYGWAGKTLLFGSELKALRAYPGFEGTIDRRSLVQYLRFNCVPSPRSIYTGTRKLPAGTCIRFSASGEKDPQPVVYWSLRDVAIAGLADPFRGSDADAVDALEALLRDAVKIRTVADVPVGSFLSGGIDSSTVTAMLQAVSPQARTFSIALEMADYNEADDARRVAQHLSTDHTELCVTAELPLAVIPRLPTIYDEPFSDSSQIPTFLVAQLARQKVTVALSGDGGDEVFAGYNRHAYVGSMWKRIGWMPRASRQLLARFLRRLSPASWDALFRAGAFVVPRRARHRTIGDKLHKLAGVLGAPDVNGMWLGLLCHWDNAGEVVLGAEDVADSAYDPWLDTLPDIVQRMSFLDTIGYLHDDILVKLDRATMAVSLEGRVPLLDKRIVAFSWRLPTHMKIRGGETKWILRQVLSRYVPRAYFDRPKAGFGIPIGEWLRGPLRDWAESLLNPARLRHEGFFSPEAVRVRWDEHLAGKANWAYHIWDVLMFQAWLEATPEPAIAGRAMASA